MGGKQKNKKSTNAESNRLKKKQRPHKAFPHPFPNSCYTETDLREPVHVSMRPLTAKQTAHHGPRCIGKPAVLYC